MPSSIGTAAAVLCGEWPKDAQRGQKGQKGQRPSAALHSASPPPENVFGKGFAVLAERHKCLLGGWSLLMTCLLFNVQSAGGTNRR